MITPTALTTPLPSPAKLPWETPLCLPLEVAVGTEKSYANPIETAPSYGPAS